MVDGTLYLSTPFGRVIALDPATGRERWTYDAHVDRHGGLRRSASRGVSTWLDPRAPAGAPCRRRIYLATLDARLVALDARTGHAVPRASATTATCRLRGGLRNTPFETAEYELTSPPGGDQRTDRHRLRGGRQQPHRRAPAARCAPSTRAPARCAGRGIPCRRTPPIPHGRRGAARWRTRTGAANAWSVHRRRLGARPRVRAHRQSRARTTTAASGSATTATPTPSSRCARRRERWCGTSRRCTTTCGTTTTRRRRRSSTITQADARVDVVLQATKTGQLFVLDRDTGAPVFPVEERAVPRATIAGEQASPTQPFNTRDPAALAAALRAGQRVGRHATPTATACARADRGRCATRGRSRRRACRARSCCPANIGGAHWGGVAFDPARADRRRAGEHARGDGAAHPARRGSTRRDARRTHRGSATSTRACTARRTSCAADAVRRRVACRARRRRSARWSRSISRPARSAWRVPLGDPADAAAGARRRLARAARTAEPRRADRDGGRRRRSSAPTFDHLLRAFDTETGRELWRGPLPARRTGDADDLLRGRAAVRNHCVGGGDDWGRGDTVVAFALR